MNLIDRGGRELRTNSQDRNSAAPRSARTMQMQSAPQSFVSSPSEASKITRNVGFSSSKRSLISSTGKEGGVDFGRPNDVLPATRMAAEELAVDVQSTNLSNKFEIEAEGMMTYSDSPSERGGGGAHSFVSPN